MITSQGNSKQVYKIEIVNHFYMISMKSLPSKPGRWHSTSIQGTRRNTSECRGLRRPEMYRDFKVVEEPRIFAIGCIGALLVSCTTISTSALAEEPEIIPGLDQPTTELVDQGSSIEQELDPNRSPDMRAEQDVVVKGEQKSTKRKGRIRELEEIKAELAKKELELLSKENALLEKEQNMLVLRQELEIERNIRALITKEKEQAEEEAALAMGLCTGSTMLP